ncbi:MAG: diacylglycerol/lipid kinase family protein [Wenzhouxiangella sp.]
MSTPITEPAPTGTDHSPVPAGLPAETCILVNPRSFRISDGARLDQVCRTAGRADTPVHIVHEPDEIAAALQAHRDEPPRRLVVIGGDGTVQAALSALSNQFADPLPPVLVLGGGRTNFTARDLGTHRSLVGLLQRVLRNPQGLNTEQRRMLILEQPASRCRVQGFFIAGALVDHVIRDCHRYRARHRGWLRTGHPSSAWRVAQLAALAALGRSDFEPPVMRIDAGRLGVVEQPVRILIFSSLSHQRGWLDPYAARGSGAVRLTAIARSAPGFWRRLPGLLRGRLGPDQQAGNGYLSGRTDQVVVHGLPGVCVDGQEYPLRPDCEVLIRPGPTFRFLVP